MTSVSRAEGYAAGAGKEELGLRMTEHFFREKIGVEPLERVSGIANFFLGDHIFPSGKTIETKRQPIDPFRYNMNVVEAFELTKNQKHADGWRMLSRVLGADVDQLQSCKYFEHDVGDFVNLPTGHVNPSLVTAARAAAYCYVNPEGPYLYLCPSKEIRREALKAFLSGSLRRGPGRVNDVAWVFFCENPPMRWRYSKDSKLWVWIGDGDEHVYLDAIRRLVSP